jgi:hypothetical protein
MIMKWTLEKLHRECTKANRHEIYRRHRLDIFPSELWYSKTWGVGLFKQSEGGYDYGVNRAALMLLKKALDNGNIENGAALFVKTDENHRVTEIIGYVTVDKLYNNLKRVTPIEGKFGDFNWVDENGNARTSNATMPFDESDRNPEDDMPF